MNHAAYRRRLKADPSLLDRLIREEGWVTTRYGRTVHLHRAGTGRISHGCDALTRCGRFASDDALVLPSGEWWEPELCGVCLAQFEREGVR